MCFLSEKLSIQNMPLPYLCVRRPTYGVPLGSKVCIFSGTKNIFCGTKIILVGVKIILVGLKIILVGLKLIFSGTKNNFSPTHIILVALI